MWPHWQQLLLFQETQHHTELCSTCRMKLLFNHHLAAQCNLSNYVSCDERYRVESYQSSRPSMFFFCSNDYFSDSALFSDQWLDNFTNLTTYYTEQWSSMSFLSYIANPVQQSAEQMRKMIQVSAVMPAPGVGETGSIVSTPTPGNVLQQDRWSRDPHGLSQWLGVINFTHHWRIS